MNEVLRRCVEKLWALEWVLGGGMVITPLMDAMERNHHAAINGLVADPRVLLGLFENVEQAQEGKRVLTRLIKEARPAAVTPTPENKP